MTGHSLVVDGGDTGEWERTGQWLCWPSKNDQVTFGIDEVTNHKVCAQILHWPHPARPAMALGLLERRLDIEHADAGSVLNIVVRLFATRSHSPALTSACIRSCAMRGIREQILFNPAEPAVSSITVNDGMNDRSVWCVICQIKA